MIEERVTKLEHRSVEITEFEKERKKVFFKNEQHSNSCRIEKSNVVFYLEFQKERRSRIGIGKKRGNNYRKLCKFGEKDSLLHVQEVHLIPNRINPK